MENSVDGLIVIRPVGRSGSIFLHSLFDSHPEILSLPFSFPYYFSWKLFHSSFRLTRPSPEALIDFFIRKTSLRFLFEGSHDDFCSWTDESGKTREFKISMDAFTEDLRRRAGSRYPSRREFLVFIHRAYARTAQLDADRARYLLLHEHYPYEFDSIRQDFADAKEIVTVRSPRNVYASTVKYALDRKGPVIFAPFAYREMSIAVSTMVNSFIYARRHPENIRFVKTEELNAAPRRTLQDLAEWIGIGFDEILMKPTFAGFPRSGLSVFNKRQTGFDSKGLSEHRWRNFCSERELRVIDRIFRGVNRRFGYSDDIVSFSKSLLLIALPDFKVIKYRSAGVKGFFCHLVSLNWLVIRFFFLKGLLMSGRRRYISLPLLSIRCRDWIVETFRLKHTLKIG